MAVSRHMDRLAEPLLKGRHKGPVFCRSTLEAYGLTNACLNSHLCEVIFPHGVEGGCQHFIGAVSLAQVIIYVPLHEDRASVRRHGGPSALCPSLILIKRAAHFFALLLDEAARAGGADGVHG